MADISKINLGGTDYNIKDVTARNEASKLATQSQDGRMSAEDKRHLDAALYTVDNTQYFSDYVETDVLGWDGDGHSITINAATKSKAGVMSAADKSRLDSLVAASGNGVHFIGTTSTALTDGATTSTLVAASSGSLTKTTGFIAGDLVFYGNKEFIWNGKSWTLFGDLGDLGTLAFKNSASVFIPSTIHKHSTPSLSHTVTQGNVSASGSYTPGGTVTIANRTDIESWEDGAATTDPKTIGIGRKILTDYETTDVTITGVGGTTSVQSITGVGTLPTLGTKFTIPNVTGVGSLPTSEAKSIPNVTSVGKMFAASISGETLTLTPGSAPTLGTAISVNSMKSAGSLPTLGTAFSVPNVTGVGTLPTRQAVTVATAGAEQIFTAVSLTDWDDSQTTHSTIAETINASFSGKSASISVSGKTSGVAIADHAAGTTGVPSATENKAVTFS